MVPGWLMDLVKRLWMVAVFSIAALVLVLAVLVMRNFPTSNIKTTTFADYDPCCGYPCLNQGVCMSWPKSYSCDCTDTGYYGTHCQIPTWFSRVSAMVKPDVSTVHTFLTGNAWVWAVLNRIPFVHKKLLAYVYLSHGDIVDSPPAFESDHSFVTLDAYFNSSYYARALPPVPEHCPTPMGIKGHKDYPDIDVVIEKVFQRRKFIPEPHNSNVLFVYYAQHFTHQFFRTADSKNAPQLTNSSTGGVYASNIYGFTESDRQAFRSRVNGKLRTQVIDGEEFPPYLKDVPGVTMSYPENMNVTETEKFALGHPFFSLLPGLFVYSTIWMREHNRVCDELLKIHSDWSDERLYHTARLIIIGEIIEITIVDFVQHLSQYKLQLAVEPTLIHNTRFQFNNRIHLEFTYLYHWHPLNPDTLKVAGVNYSTKKMLYRTAHVFKHGFDTFVQALINNRAGALTARNHSPILLNVLSTLLQNGRQLRIQGVNAYRRRFDMKPFTSFEDMTGEKELATVLEELYGDIEAVELYVGLLAERPGPSVTPMGMMIMGGPWSLKDILANPICSLRYWKPSTFGGDMGMEIVKTASLKKLFCLNMKSECQDIGFTVPNK